MSCAGRKEPDQVKWVGVRPTDPEGDAIPVKLQDANCQPQGVPANPVSIDIEEYLGSSCGSSNPIDVQDTGLNTNPERWLHIHHWNPEAQVTITAAGVAGEQELGDAVATSLTRRIREVTARHAGTNNTVVSILDESGGNIIVSFDVPAQSTRTWSSQDGRAVTAGLTPVVQSSDVTGGNTIVSVAGVEA